jgi:TolB protein
MHGRIGSLGAVLVVVAIIGVTAIGSATAAFRGSNGRIAFDDGRTFPSKIGTMAKDGSDVRILTENGDHWPRWSPDGKKIVFFSTRTPDGSDAADAEIYVMNADGSDQTALTDNAVEDQVPNWTPDGRIIWSQRSDTTRYDLWIMNVDGSNKHQLTTFVGGELWPSVSPQGTRVAFTGNFLDGKFHLFTMRLDGTDVRQITSDVLEDWAPDWSPSGNDIVFSRETPRPDTPAGADEDTYTIHSDGTGLHQISGDPNRTEVFPVWSPDGKSLLYPAITDWFGPNWNTLLTVYNLKTGVETTVGDPNIGGAPSWQPIPPPVPPGSGG